MNVRRWLPPVVWAAFILILTSIPGRDLPGIGIPHLDKAVHLCLYAIFAWLLTRAVAVRAPFAGRVVLVLVAVLCFGAADEWHQQFIPGRSMDVYDWIADSTGALAGAATFLLRRERSDT